MPNYIFILITIYFAIGFAVWFYHKHVMQRPLNGRLAGFIAFWLPWVYLISKGYEMLLDKLEEDDDDNYTGSITDYPKH